MKKLYLLLFATTILLTSCKLENIKFPNFKNITTVLGNSKLNEKEEAIKTTLEKNNPTKTFDIYFSEKTSIINRNNTRYYIHSTNDDLYFTYYSNEEMYKDFYKKIKIDNNAVKIVEKYITENYGYNSYVKIDGGREHNEDLSNFTLENSSFDILQNSLDENKETYFNMRIFILDADTKNFNVANEKEMIDDLINNFILKYKDIDNFSFGFKITYLKPKTKTKVNKGGVETFKSEFSDKNIFKSYYLNSGEDFSIKQINFD